ncbi:MAG: replicative DNA helicase [Planctomycetota bacterium]|nr:replicative DNA helicase [Planctomycetota bacterium]
MATQPKKFKKRQDRGSEQAEPIVDRPPPFNLEAETGVLGSLMLMPEACDEIVNILRSTDFYDEAHGQLFAHIMEMHSSGKKIDMTLLRERLVTHDHYEMIGGAAGLAEIFTTVPSAAHAVYYATIVREKATMRNLISTCTEILTEAYQPAETSEQLLNRAEQKVFGIRESRQSSNLAQIDEVLEVAMDRLEARVRGESQPGTVESGFSDLDRLTGGLHASELVILAARPSMGKTAFAMNIAENVAMKSRKPVLFVSLEMAAIELIERMLCSVAKVNGHRLRNGTLSGEDRKRLVRVAGELSQAPLFLDDSPTRNVSEIAGAARRVLRKEGELGLIVVDYLQLIQPDHSSDPRQEQVAKMARRLKGLARELKVPILCLAQLNRQAEDSRDHRPKLSHLRESGAIEQDADVVMFVHRKDYYASQDDDSSQQGEALIIVGKQRNGPTDDVELSWLREFTRFEDRAAERFSEFDQFEPASFDSPG